MSKEEVCNGVIIWFNDRRGYGFLQPDDGGKDLFVHYSNIISDANFKTLVAGQKVSYTIGSNKNGPQAEQVKIVE